MLSGSTCDLHGGHLHLPPSLCPGWGLHSLNIWPLLPLGLSASVWAVECLSPSLRLGGRISLHLENGCHHLELTKHLWRPHMTLTRALGHFRRVFPVLSVPLGLFPESGLLSHSGDPPCLTLSSHAAGQGPRPLLMGCFHDGPVTGPASIPSPGVPGCFSWKPHDFSPVTQREEYLPKAPKAQQSQIQLPLPGSRAYSLQATAACCLLSPHPHPWWRLSSVLRASQSVASDSHLCRVSTGQLPKATTRFVYQLTHKPVELLGRCWATH